MLDMIIDNHNKEGDYYLVKSKSDDWYLVFLKLPNDEYTLNQYREWQRGNTYNAICISSHDTFPQILPHSIITEFISISEIISNLAKDNDMILEDCYRVFFGGVKGDEFSELYLSLIKSESTYASYVQTIKLHYNVVLGKIRDISSIE